MHIFCLGDSLTRGYGVRSGQDYPSQLGLLLRERGVKVEIDNFGIDGQTSAELLAEVNRQIAGAKPGDIALLLIGSNDALGQRLPVEAYIQNLGKLTQLIQSKEVKLLLATLPPVEADYFYGEDPNRRIMLYNQAVRKLAGENKLKLVELSEIDASFTTDGVHYGDKGYKLIAEYWGRNI